MIDLISEEINAMFAEQAQRIDEKLLPQAMKYAQYGYGTKLRYDPVSLKQDGGQFSLSQDVWILPSKEVPAGEVVDVLGRIRKAIASIEDAKRTIFVHPSREERIREAVEHYAWPGLIEVQVTEACPTDQIFILPTQPMFASAADLCRCESPNLEYIDGICSQCGGEA